LQEKKTIFHQDNAPAYKNVLAVGKLRDLHYELLEHPPYSQIWLPLTSVSSQNSHSSSLVSVFLRVKRQITAVKGYFADLTKNHYRDGIMALEHRWNKCISLKGDYVEKQK
jgi:hypothetical protein